jgi:hypothetical protein
MGLLVVAVSVRLDIVTRRRAAAARCGQALPLRTMPFVAGVLVLIPDSQAGCSGWLVPTVILAVVGGVGGVLSAPFFLLEDTPIQDDAPTAPAGSTQRSPGPPSTSA